MRNNNNKHCKSVQRNSETEPQTDNNFKSGMAKYFQFRRKYFSVQFHVRNTCDLTVLCYSRLV